MHNLNQKGIYNLQDLIKYGLGNFTPILLKHWQDVIFYDFKALQGTQTQMFEKETLKPLPCGARKQKIFNWYPLEPEKNFRILIHAIQIESNPHLSAYDAIRRRHLNRKELKKIVDIIGPPEGYTEKFK